MLPRISFWISVGRLAVASLRTSNSPLRYCLTLLQPLQQDLPLPQQVLIAAGLEVALHLRHDVDHLLQVGVMVVG